MSGLGDILSGIAKERKTPKGEGKHYIPFTHAEWDALAEAFGCSSEELKPNQLKSLIQAIALGKVRLEKVIL